jgi:hypothetical protein
MSIGVTLLVVSVVVLGCGGGQQGGGQQQEQTSDESTQEEEELLPVTKVSAARMYVGRVAGIDAFIGIAVQDQTNELIAYVCNGPPAGPPEAATIEAWFQGPIEGDAASLRADGGDEQLRGNVNPGSITGTFTDQDGQTHDFQAEPVDPEGNAGLYWTQLTEGEGLSSRGGTIILTDGEELGKRKPSTRPKGN